MKTIHRFKIQSLILASILSVGLGFASLVFGQPHTSYLVDPTGGVTQVGDLDTTAIAINDTAQVLGFGSPPGLELPNAFITGPNGVGMTYLYEKYPRDIDDSIHPSDFNNDGQVVGTYGRAADSRRGFILDSRGLRSLVILPYHPTQNATAINNSGQVVVNSGTAFITGPNGVGMTGLGTLLGNQAGFYTHSLGTAVNNAGQVVGWSDTALGAQHAFITGPGGAGMTDLGTLGGPDSSSFATDINDTGQVAGYFETPGGEYHAFITGPDGVGMTDLGTLGGTDSSSFATGINNAGEVVGFFGNDAQVNRGHATAGSHSHAFVTGPNGIGMTDLNSLVNFAGGQVLKEAVGINNAGQVIANGSVSTIPEPESYVLVLAGLGLLVAVVRRRDMPKTF